MIAQKEKARRVYVNLINFVRVKILEKPELDTPEKRIQDEEKKVNARIHYEKIIKNIDVCHNKLQVDTIRIIMDLFIAKYGELGKDLYIDMKEHLNLKMDKLCMYH